MKIVLNLSRFSSFSEHNYKTFEVNMFVGDKLVNIKIDEKTSIDVSFKEVIIVDFHEEMQRKYDVINWGLVVHKQKNAWSFLSNYAVHNKINLGFLKADCPA